MMYKLKEGYSYIALLIYFPLFVAFDFLFFCLLFTIFFPFFIYSFIFQNLKFIDDLKDIYYKYEKLLGYN